MSFLIAISSLLVVLGVLVFVHEAGHFLAAKLSGIYVHRFSLGLGSPIRRLSFTRGGTEYAVSWLPLGGYVKMATAEEEATSSALEGGRPSVVVPPNQMFEAKPVWVRMVVILAGVTMNALFAWFAFTYLALKNGQLVDPVTVVGRVEVDSLPAGAEALKVLRPGDQILSVARVLVHSWDEIDEGIKTASGSAFALQIAGKDSLVLNIHPSAIGDRIHAAEAIHPYRRPVVGTVVPGGPAAQAGIAVGDTILRVDDDTVAQWYDMVDRIRGGAGRALAFTIVRSGERRIIRVTPQPTAETDADGTSHEVGKIGISEAVDRRSEKYTVGQAILAGARATGLASTEIVRMVHGMLSHRISTKEVGGPILIAQQAGQFARLGFDAFLEFMALISVNLAVLNLLPIPVLDGGQFMFLLAEAILRRPLSVKLRERLTLVGLVLIAMLMTLAFSNDIARNWGLIGRFFQRLVGR